MNTGYAIIPIKEYLEEQKQYNELKTEVEILRRNNEEWRSRNALLQEENLKLRKDLIVVNVGE